MKQVGTVLIATAFIIGSGFWGKDKEGNSSIPDISSLTQSAGDASEKASAMSQEAMEKTKKAAAAIQVKSEELLGDLGKTTEQIKQKISEMDQAETLAYVNQYKQVFIEKKDEIAAASMQLKELPWKEKMGAKSKELQKKISEYATQLDGLKTQSAFYLEKLESYGVDLSAYGL